MDTQGRPLRILIMATEVEPFVKASEIDGVIGSLANMLAALGQDVRIAMPLDRRVNAERFALEQPFPPFLVPMDGHSEVATVYRGTIGTGVPVYMLSSPRYLHSNSASIYADDPELYIFYSRATLELLKQPQLAWQPDVIHCHDWQTAIVPNLLSVIYLRDPFYAHTATVFTIRRLAYQGIFGYRVLQLAGLEKYGFILHNDLVELSDLVDLLARGVYYADIITTDSPHYAQEIQTPEMGERLDPLFRERRERLIGIVNGLDLAAFDPATDPELVAPYNAASLGNRHTNKGALQRTLGLEVNPTVPLIGMVAPLVEDKGLDLLSPILEPMMTNLALQFAVVGSGEPKYQKMLHEMAQRFPGRVGWLPANEDGLERRMYAGCDMVLIPSLTEPCDLCPMIAIHYGCVPIVRSVGILADLVRNYAPGEPSSNGFTFEAYDALALYTAIVRAVEIYQHPELWTLLQERGMSANFSWDGPVEGYLAAYRRALGLHEQALSGTR
jgi:starch synthase